MVKQKIHYQTLVYNNHTAFQFQTFTVSIKNFAALQIRVTGSNTDNFTNVAVFNNSIELQPYICTMLGTAINPWFLDLIGNENELDQTQMTIRVPVGVTFTMIFKFYTN
jgi:hypothetical protein